MHDPNTLLLDTLRQGSGNRLLVADENCRDFPFDQLPDAVQVFTNRVDIARLAERAGTATHFSDFDFSHCAARSVACLAYRLSKEKAVVHHIANQARSLLAAGGTLVLVGGKQEGIKTFAKTLGKALGSAAILEKHGTVYRAVITRGNADAGPLDDHDYSRLRTIFSVDGKPVCSKPGLFGWDRVDQGSALLADHLADFFATLPTAPQRLLDLGCGYGYLALAASRLGHFHITATDNCAAAIRACQHNFERHGITGTVVADDSGETLPPGYDVILCNPPFHQGFQADRRLTETFVANCHRLLDRRGRALFVVNVFVPLESLADTHFAQGKVVLNNGRFKLIELSSPRVLR
ncbi:MAG: methyltransferase [Porticoccaceae bacterium]